MRRSKLYMLIGSLLLTGLFLLPIWKITLEAPQYPDSIGMYIYINKFAGVEEHDIKNINIMNHYVGMKEIPEVIPEFAIFPYVVSGMVILGLIFGFIGKRKLYLLWFGLMAVFGSIAMYDFYQWEYDYGHNLKENAAIKFVDENGDPLSYQPPLIGSKTILNFKAVSIPMIGAYLLFGGMCLSVFAFLEDNREQLKKEKAKQEQANEKIMQIKVRMNALHKISLLLSLIGLLACEIKPQTIHYGMDACDFCQMTIVDKQHAAQVVTEKGKAYKYDAIECMMNALRHWDRPPVAYYLVTDYASPGAFTNASEAYYLISPAIPSPMGEYLTAFADKDVREKAYEEAGGTTLEWNQLRERYNASANNR